MCMFNWIFILEWVFKSKLFFQPKCQQVLNANKEGCLQNSLEILFIEWYLRKVLAIRM